MIANRADPARPVVSVVTPLYNSSSFIDETLESLQAQTFEDWEVILVDDGSTDDTPQRVHRFLEDERFSYVRQANQGIAAARNRAIDGARGDWIAFLDHDDRWRPEKLERQLDAAERHGWEIICTEADIVREGRRTRYSDHLPEETRRALVHPHYDPDDLYTLLIGTNFLCASSVLLRRSLFDQHGLLEPALAPADDYDMWLRCAEHNPVGYVPESLVDYVLHTSNHSWNTVTMRMATIRVLSRTLVRCARHEARRRACQDALTVHHAVLFQELMRSRAYWGLAAQALRLGRHGLQGLRIFVRAWRIRHQVRAGF